MIILSTILFRKNGNKIIKSGIIRSKKKIKQISRRRNRIYKHNKLNALIMYC